MVVVVRAHRLEAGDAVAEVEPLQETLLGERVEDTVDGRQADRRPVSPQLVVDLLRAETARLLVEEPNDREAGGPAPIARGAKLGERPLRPGCGGPAHRADDNGDENRYRLSSDENRSRLVGGSRAPRGRLCRLGSRQR